MQLLPALCRSVGFALMALTSFFFSAGGKALRCPGIMGTSLWYFSRMAWTASVDTDGVDVSPRAAYTLMSSSGLARFQGLLLSNALFLPRLAWGRLVSFM